MVTGEPYWERLKRLRTEAGLSQPQLYRLVDGVSFDTVRALEQPYEKPGAGRRSRARYPSLETLEKVAAALKVDPAEFPEYKLGKARQMLDERSVGLDQALASLEQVIAGLDALTQRAATAEPPTSLLSLLPGATEHGATSSQEDAR